MTVRTGLPAIVEVRRGARGLELAFEGDARGASIDIDEIRRRLKQGRRLALGRACGAVDGAKVLDAMAGLGVDGVTLACLGAHVTLVEREPSTYAVLCDGLARARAELAPRGTLDCVHADAADMLHAARYDVIYLDPMFPQRRKAALPRLRAQLLAAAATDEAELPSLIVAARRAARMRVVVKRRAKDPCAITPDWTIRGKTVRFDVYAAASTEPSPEPG